jgi:CHAD domain-containing protein
MSMTLPAEAASRLSALVDRFASEMARSLEHPEPDEVHDLRVAIRRLDQAFELYREWLPSKAAKKMQRRIHDVLKLAGDVRDCDIAVHLEESLELQLAEKLRARIQRLRERGLKRLTTEVDGLTRKKTVEKWRSQLMLDDVHEAAPALIAQTAATVLPDAAEQFIQSGSRLAEGRGSGRRLHALRIAAKQLRYSLEPFSDLYGAGMRKRIESVRDVQTVLGHLQDCVATRRMLRDLGASREMVAPLRAEQEKRFKEFRELWPERFGPSAAGSWKRYLSRPVRPLANARGSVKAAVTESRP